MSGWQTTDPTEKSKLDATNMRVNYEVVLNSLEDGRLELTNNGSEISKRSW